MEQRSLGTASARAAGYSTRAIWARLDIGGLEVARITAPSIAAVALAPQGGQRN